VSKEHISVRLYPTGLTADGGGRTRSVWRAVYENVSMNQQEGVFTSSCAFTWVQVDTSVYVSVGFDEFVFMLGDDGQAVSVEPRVTRAVLRRVGVKPEDLCVEI
jgi:hypothetical protein